jgi:hypothetical protein
LSVRFSVNRSAEACVTFAANDWRDVRFVGDQGNLGIHVRMNIDNVVDGNLRLSHERIPFGNDIQQLSLRPRRKHLRPNTGQRLAH